MDVDLTKKWSDVEKFFETKFDIDPSLEGILLLIGIQELGKIPEKLSKDQKLEVMHIAICSLLSNYGYYEFVGEDEDGWPHYNRLKKLPNLSDREQDTLIKDAIITYVLPVIGE